MSTFTEFPRVLSVGSGWSECSFGTDAKQIPTLALVILWDVGEPAGSSGSPLMGGPSLKL